MAKFGINPYAAPNSEPDEMAPDPIRRGYRFWFIWAAVSVAISVVHVTLFFSIGYKIPRVAIVLYMIPLGWVGYFLPRELNVFWMHTVHPLLLGGAISYCLFATLQRRTTPSKLARK